MGAQGSVTRLIIDLRSDEPGVREVAARLVWGRYLQELLLLARSHLSRGSAAGKTRKTSFRACTRASASVSAGAISTWPTGMSCGACWCRSLCARPATRPTGIFRERETSGGKTLGLPDRSGEDLPTTILDQIDSDGPTPAEAALLNEALERRFQMLKDPNLHQIALWKLEGYTNPEIAAQLECTVRTVERKLERIRGYWEATDA